MAGDFRGKIYPFVSRTCGRVWAAIALRGSLVATLPSEFAIRFFKGGPGFAEKCAVVASGHALGYGLALLAAPILSRLYSPRDFGLMAIFTALTAIGGTLATLRYDHAIPLPKDEPSAASLARLAGRLRFGFTCCLLVAALLWGDSLDQLLFGARDAPFTFLLAASVAAISSYQVHNAWMVRHGRFGDLSRMRIYYVSACLAAQLTIPIVWRTGPLGLLAGQVCGYAVASAAMWAAATGKAARPTCGADGSISQVAATYRKYPLLDVWSCLLRTLSTYGLTMGFAWAYGPATAGGLALAQRVLATPVAMLGASVSRVYYSEAALRLDQPDRLRQLFARTLRQLLLLAAPPLALAAIVAPLAFGSVFGPHWQSAGVYCTLLSPLILSHLICYVLGSTLDVVNRQGLRLTRELTTSLCIATGLVGANWLQWPAVAAVAATSALGCAGYAVSLLLTYRAILKQRPQLDQSTAPSNRAEAA